MLSYDRNQMPSRPADRDTDREIVAQVVSVYLPLQAQPLSLASQHKTHTTETDTEADAQTRENEAEHQQQLFNIGRSLGMSSDQVERTLASAIADAGSGF